MDRFRQMGTRMTDTPNEPVPAISPLSDDNDIDNLRNRIEASKHADNYAARTVVDVPTHIAERLLARFTAETAARKAAEGRIGSALAIGKTDAAARWVAESRVKELEDSGADPFHRLRAAEGQAMIDAEKERRKVAEAKVEKLEAFKAFVHACLDRAGVPTDPPGEHRDARCRIGQRLDVLIRERDDMRANHAELVASVETHGNERRLAVVARREAESREQAALARAEKAEAAAFILGTEKAATRHYLTCALGYDGAHPELLDDLSVMARRIKAMAEMAIARKEWPTSAEANVYEKLRAAESREQATLAEVGRLRGALKKLYRETTEWVLLPPGDGLCATDEPYECPTCGERVATDVSPDRRKHADGCAYVGAEAALAANPEAKAAEPLAAPPMEGMENT